jgi:hypothetical protein
MKCRRCNIRAGCMLKSMKGSLLCLGPFFSHLDALYQVRRSNRLANKTKKGRG